jgi:hypothetical protein
VRTRIISGAILLASATVAAQPTPAATAQPRPTPVTEDRDPPSTADTLPWYLPPPEVAAPIRARTGIPLTGALAYHSLAGDLNGSIDEFVLTIGVGKPQVDVGIAVGSGTLVLNDTQNGQPRSITNNSNTYEFVLGFARHYGAEIYREGNVHVFIMGPAAELRFGGQPGQDTNQTTPFTTGTIGSSPSVVLAGLVAEPVGLRVASCDGWFADVRATYGFWVAARDFDPSVTSSAANTNRVGALGKGFGITIEAGWAFWQ